MGREGTGHNRESRNQTGRHTSRGKVGMGREREIGGMNKEEEKKTQKRIDR